MADALEVGGGAETRFEPVELHNKAIKLGPALACPSAEGGDGGGLRHEPSTRRTSRMSAVSSCKRRVSILPLAKCMRDSCYVVVGFCKISVFLVI